MSNKGKKLSAVSIGKILTIVFNFGKESEPKKFWLFSF